MELKQHYRGICRIWLYALLIVPYGIETQHIRQPCRLGWALLIVPYGIETL